MGFLRSAIGACIALLAAGAAAAAPVKVSGGLVEGRSKDGIAIYQGIPFAAPPVGPLRWKPPQPVVPWQGVKQTIRYAPACAQAPVTLPNGKTMPGPAQSEDCLYLNVWAPPHKAGEKLPVMVWIYGGGFELGWSSMPVYDGTALAKKGVIVVTIAYRVGPLGFLASPALSAEAAQHSSGDYGLMDQIAALHWVKHNIAGFGGDPRRVTIFGESAGGMSVNMLAASPLAKGLFSGAISESGGAMTPPRRGQEGGLEVVALPHAEEIGREFLRRLGADTLAEARALPAEKIVQAAGAGLTGYDTGMIGGNFWAVADGYVLPADVEAVYRAGQQNDTPAIIGFNSDEGFIFPRPTTAKTFKAMVREKFGPFAQRILAAYPARSDAEAARSAAALTGDAVIVWPSLEWARAQAKTGRGKVFIYELTRHAAGAPGALHGDEIPYVFDNLDAMAGKHYTEADRKLADTISTYWTNFAKRGNPNGEGLPHWPRYTTKSPRQIDFAVPIATRPVRHDVRLKVLSDYFEWRRREASTP